MYIFNYNVEVKKVVNKSAPWKYYKIKIYIEGNVIPAI